MVGGWWCAEFYSVESPAAGEFLSNGLHLELGIKQNGKEVNDVILPPWVTSGSPRDFISTCRDALESDYVSSTIHRSPLHCTLHRSCVVVDF